MLSEKASHEIQMKTKKILVPRYANKAIHCLVMQIVCQNYKETKGMIH